MAVLVLFSYIYNWSLSENFTCVNMIDWTMCFHRYDYNFDLCKTSLSSQAIIKIRAAKKWKGKRWNVEQDKNANHFRIMYVVEVLKCGWSNKIFILTHCILHIPSGQKHRISSKVWEIIIKMLFMQRNSIIFLLVEFFRFAALFQ